MGYEYEFRKDDPAALGAALTAAEAFAASNLGAPRDHGGVRSYPLAPTEPSGREGWLQFTSTHVLLSVASRRELGSPLVRQVLGELERLGLDAYEEGDPTPTGYDDIG